eukprot:10177691-Karenia_brevis.AAC.1
MLNSGCERLHIYNHRTYHEKMANVSRPVALLRNIRIILASGPQKIVFWCGWYHSRLFDVLCPTVTLYDGRLKTVPSFVGIDLKLAVGQSCLQQQSYGSSFKAVVLGQDLHISMRQHLAYADTENFQ